MSLVEGLNQITPWQERSLGRSLPSIDINIEVTRLITWAAAT